MQRSNIRTLGLCGLTLSASILTGCGDPCLDDGAGAGNAACEQAGDGDGDTDGTGDGDGDGSETGDTIGDGDGDGDGDPTGDGDGDEPDENWCADEDMDGFGDPEECEPVPAGEDPPAGSVPEGQATDCDDADPNTFPGAAELDDPDACMTDADDDGWGDDMPSNPNAQSGTDCDDANDHAFPGAAELDDPDACMEDDDEDGWGDYDPSGDATLPGVDCDDTDPQAMMCDIWCEDTDTDGFGNPDACVPVPPGDPGPIGYVQDNTDCDDTEPNAYPGAAEIEDPDACMLDDDMDGWGEGAPPDGVVPGLDCDDADLARVICADAIPGCVDTSQGLEAQLMATATGGDGNYTYAWTPIETLDDPNIADPIATPDTITTYTVNVTDGAMNMDSDKVTVHLIDKPWVLGGPDAECEAVGFLGDPATHSFSMDGYEACTTSNSDPTAFICPIVHEQTRITGELTVTDDTGDNDIIGFVWGWQDMNQFYLFQWKKEYQFWYNCDGPAGMMVRKFDAQGGHISSDFACATDTANQTVLMTPADIYDQGWVEGVEYGVEVLYDLTQTEITITDLADDSVVANFVVMDDSYPSGQFGTYDFSQENACNGPWQSNCL